MQLNEYNQQQLDAIKGAVNPEDPYLQRQVAAIEKGLGRQQKVSEDAEEALAKMRERQASLVRALRGNESRRV